MLFRSDETYRSILRRFSNVFGLAYRRFADLKQAEAQTREAQIQLALERVRARTMAMHNSSELIETAELLFEQLRLLGAESLGVAFGICEPDNIMVKKWTSIGIFSVPYTSEAGEERMYEAWKNQIEIYEEVYAGEKLRRYYELFMEIPEFKEGFQKMLDSGLSLPTWQKNHAIPFKYGYLLLITYKPFEETHIFIRFAKVFDQTYTRFLDLQKAEAQAREAQIEAALEKIRSRSLAMHKSDELKEVIASVFQRLKELALDFDAAAIQLFKEGSKDWVMWVASPDVISEPLLINLPYDKDLLEHSEFFNTVWNARINVEDIINKKYLFHEKNKYYAYVIKYNPQIPAGVGEMMLQATSYTHTVIMEKNSALIADSWYEKTLSVDDYNILKRVAKVFEQAYIRFLDLQKAEAQAREAQIEAALERVRSRSMGMQQGEDLKSVVKELYEQLRLLGFKFGVASIIIMDSDSGDLDWWMEGFEDGYDLPEKYHVPYFDHKGHKKQLAHWKSGSNYAVIEIAGPDKKTFDSYYFFKTDFAKAPESSKNLMMSAESVVFSMAYMKYGALSWSPSELDESQAIVLQRMAKVFEQTYTRFLDLQKAEAQAREAQIEAALEKVRNVSLAMQKSSELQNVIVVVFEKLRDLGLKFEDAGISIYQEGTKDTVEWVAAPGQLSAPVFVNLPFSEVDFEESEIFRDFWNLREKGETMFNKTYSFAEKNKYFTYVGKYNDLSQVPEEVRKFQLEALGYIVSSVAEKNSGIWVDSWSGQKISKEDVQVLSRVARVFEQAYTRFLDLQKAEAQVRESQIEAALERVRARTMGMRLSSDLHEVIKVVMEQLLGLGVKFNVTNFAKIYADGSWDLWLYTADQIYPAKLFVPYLDHPIFNRVLENIKSGADSFTDIYGKDEKDVFFRHFFENTLAKDAPVERKNYVFSTKGFSRSLFRTMDIWFAVVVYDNTPFKVEENAVIKRFAGVFEQTYTRFLDLQKAEAQARESQIQLALERVRARTMAMQRSNELAEAAQLLYQQFHSLGIKTYTCAYLFIEEEKNLQRGWAVAADGSLLPDFFDFPLTGDTILDQRFQSWKNKQPIHEATLQGEANKKHHEFLVYMQPPDFAQHIVANLPDEVFFYNANFRHGYLFIVNTTPFTSEEKDIAIRFAKVFEQTYTRFLDLQKAEAQAREATRQASLDRVRGEIASMRTTKDLERITPLVWHELVTLGVPFFRCGVFIINENDQQIHAYLSTPEGKSLAVLHLHYNSHETNRKAVERWRQQKVYTDHWDRQKFQDWARAMMEQGQIKGEQQYQDGEKPPESLSLQFIPFKPGMLYVGSREPLASDQIDLVKSLADAFSVAYARYEDFKQLEEAKNKMEAAFSELNSTQTQLIHAEKMASLGELTAGIAHEIQNPLNFVNNFSEVSQELIQEIKDARALKQEDRDEDTELEILGDIEQNLEKINLHGKRASNIVKGMLEHSRTGTREKQLTDINNLADEYLRLSFHGLRAKDKSFNADFRTDLDPSIPKVNIIGQDIGRVLLNLINNAFYAVSEKSRKGNAEYHPTVIVKTKKKDNLIEILVKDNADGIPDEIVNKIFQPFFTTKPTGQGTGLGLSLSYDIVTKGHNGTLEVDTTAGVGTEFIVQLPVV